MRIVFQILVAGLVMIFTTMSVSAEPATMKAPARLKSIAYGELIFQIPKDGVISVNRFMVPYLIKQGFTRLDDAKDTVDAANELSIASLGELDMFIRAHQGERGVYDRGAPGGVLPQLLSLDEARARALELLKSDGDAGPQ